MKRQYTPPTPPTPPVTSTPGDRPGDEPPGEAPKFTLTQRNLLILLIAVVAGVATGALLTSAGVPLGQAVVAGAGAFGGTMLFLDRIVS